MVRVQVRQHQRVEVEGVTPLLQLGEHAVAELEAEQETVRFEQVSGRGLARAGNAARATEDRQSHGTTPCQLRR
ncbi:hypothetical protein GCM10022380_86890 [Amycolatopsis tucumanensis]|uniref:Uncharacterized protein n=1 Tax=Amycolatopsis tucumanensis TaxID=401106 RepID=A0ABP7JV48_9PSEU